MRDRSASYWFQIGDRVQVVEDVPKAGTNLRNRQGTVVETWEKCNVDPTCCCAEQVDLNMAVRVAFDGRAPLSDDDEVAAAAAGDSSTSSSSSSFTHYFAEDELEMVQIPPPPTSEVEEQETEETEETTETGSVAFDGMSCQAFKLDRLKMGKQAQRLAAFEASRTENSSSSEGQ
jgi:hypothetical protein